MRLPEGGLTPNGRLPLVLRRAAIEPGPDDPAVPFETAFRANGWSAGWRNGIFPYEHYHSTAHEVLGIAIGSALVRFGGEQGRELPLATGDVVVIPAGTGHRLIEAEERLLVVGAYAGGRAWDIVRPSAARLAAALARIAAVPLPEADPVDGRDGPLAGLWGFGAP